MSYWLVVKNNNIQAKAKVTQMRWLDKFGKNRDGSNVFIIRFFIIKQMFKLSIKNLKKKSKF